MRELKKKKKGKLREEAEKAKVERGGMMGMGRGGMNITPEMMQQFQNRGGAAGQGAGTRGQGCRRCRSGSSAGSRTGCWSGVLVREE